MQVSTPRKFRFAPSPNGFLHLGHAFSALFNQACARDAGASLLLRIEDIDRQRSRPEYETALIEDLRWIGFGWDEAPRRQSEHLGRYRAALDDLCAKELAFPCFCSRGDIAKACAAQGRIFRDPDGALLYPGSCKALGPTEIAKKIAAGAPFSVRLDMGRALQKISRPLGYREFYESDAAIEKTADPEVWGDALIGRRDVPASYHLACVIDDDLQDVTDVARGKDLEAATALHVLLQAMLGLKTPDYRHHRLLRDESGEKLSKSRNSPSLRDLRAKGATPADVRAALKLATGAAFL